VVLGTRNIHRFEADQGQLAAMSISSLEDNAEFAVYGPGGEAIRRNETSTDIHLPLTGEYMIVVGPSRGNATYTLSLGITG